MTPEENNHPEWLPERLERAKRAAIQDLLAEAGFEALEDLQKTLAEVPRLNAEREDLAERLAAAESARRQAYLDAAFLFEAGPYRFISLDEARLLLDWTGIELNEEAQCVEGMREALDQLVSQRPHLLRRSTPPPLDADTRGSSGPRSLNELPAEQVEALKRRFKLW